MTTQTAKTETMVQFEEMVSDGTVESLFNASAFLEEEGIISDAYDYTGDFVETDMIDELVKERLENGDWQSVAVMLSDINYMNDNYYHIDGYGNLEEVSSDLIDAITSDLRNDAELYFKNIEE